MVREYWGANIEDRIEQLKDELKEDMAMDNIRNHQSEVWRVPT